ncbi:putative ABC transporter permease [Sporolactobacillus sp. Y61]|uniref:ABC transporter permease n=1 Tax=Sporolactobacillus sp. Y61 TaxID=3160863 RepID=A0AAU8ICB3_9BACL|nr:putative ABC transporter permease [Sporolactobacillus sp. THM19-2]RYL92903.1 hypothetical protein EWH91_06305 [Sporolactobacillus sp. THM19-2]
MAYHWLLLCMSPLHRFAEFTFYFTVYAFSGWLLENGYSYATAGVFYKKNLLIGPFKPMYGFAPVLLVLLTGTDRSWAWLLLLSFIIPTTVEYVSGVLLHKYTGFRWWDYSHLPAQLHGHICLPFSLCWMVLSVICIKWMHPAVSFAFTYLSGLWESVWPAVILYFFFESIMAVTGQSPQMISREDS